MKNLWHKLLMIISRKHKLDNFYTSDEWHRDIFGEMIVTKRTIFKKCSCGFSMDIRTITR